MRGATSGWRAMLSRAEPPMRPKPMPAPMIVRPIPSPAAMPEPDSVADAGASAAKAGSSDSRNTTATRPSSFSIFMEFGTPKNGKATALVGRVHRHSHEYGRQKSKNVRLEEGDEHLQQA